MNREEREEVSRRLAASAPAPHEHPGFFDGLGMLAAKSEPSVVPWPVRTRTLRIAAIAAGTAVLLSSAAYAGAFGEATRDGVRHVLGTSAPAQHDQGVHQLKIAPAVVSDHVEAGPGA